MHTGLILKPTEESVLIEKGSKNDIRSGRSDICKLACVELVIHAEYFYERDTVK